MKNLVINLDRSSDRLKHCHEQFGRLKLDFERVAAVDARDLSQSELDNITLHKDWPKPTNSEFACFMSHRKCWEILVASTDEYAAIFEDDIILSDYAVGFLESSDWVPKYVDLLRLETVKTKVYFNRWERIPAQTRHLKRMLSFQSGTGGYLISKKLACDLLRLTDNYMPVPIDHFLFDPQCDVFSRTRIYQIFPAICAQELILNPNAMKLGQSINERSIASMVEKRRGTLSKTHKILRELKKGTIKVKNLAWQKRMMVDYL